MENFSVPGVNTDPLAKLGRLKLTAEKILVYIQLRE